MSFQSFIVFSFYTLFNTISIQLELLSIQLFIGKLFLNKIINS
jgi:hypothetical protein